MIDLRSAQHLLAQQIGKQYQFGVEVRGREKDPEVFDCSELVEWFFGRLGIKVPDGSFNQYPFTSALQPWQRAPLDLGFRRRVDTGRVFHVGILLDANWIIHAKGRDYGVVLESADAFQNSSTFGGWRRIPVLAAGAAGGDAVGK